MTSLDKNIRSKKYLDSIFPDFNLSVKDRYGINELNELKTAVKALTGNDFPISSYQFIEEVIEETTGGGGGACGEFASLTGNSTTLTPLDWTYESEGITYATALSTLGVVDNNTLPSMDLVYYYGQSDPLGNCKWVIGKIGTTWYFYIFNSAMMDYDGYDIASIEDTCGVGSWTLEAGASFWSYESVTTA